MSTNIQWLAPTTPHELYQITCDRIREKQVELPFPSKLPSSFQTIECFLIGRVYRGCRSGFSPTRILTVIASVCLEDDGLLWYHVSCSKKDGSIPTYTDLQFIKKYWIGDDKWCIQVFPEKEKHVNLVEALHLWHCLEENPIPDFRKFGGI